MSIIESLKSARTARANNIKSVSPQNQHIVIDNILGMEISLIASIDALLGTVKNTSDRFNIERILISYQNHETISDIFGVIQDQVNQSNKIYEEEQAKVMQEQVEKAKLEAEKAQELVKSEADKRDEESKIQSTKQQPTTNNPSQSGVSEKPKTLSEKIDEFNKITDELDPPQTKAKILNIKNSNNGELLKELFTGKKNKVGQFIDSNYDELLEDIAKDILVPQISNI